MKIRILLTTFSNRDSARTFCEEVVQGGLAACAQIDEVTSLYMWEGQMAMDAEQRVMLKYPESKEEELIRFLKERHEYSVPEIIVLEGKTSQEYGEWCVSSCS